MSDEVSVGATRACRLDVDGARVSMSFSRGEAWLLKQLLTNVRNPPRLRELTEDPYYPRVLQKAYGLLKRADQEALQSKRPDDIGVYARGRQIRHDCKAALGAGQPWSVGDYAREHGIPTRVVATTTLKLRKAAGIARKPPQVREQSEQDYDSSKEAAE